MAEGLSHVDDQGRARMVDVGAKPETARRARAAAVVRLSAGMAGRVMRGDLPKGAVLETARIAGIQAAKRTAELIPLCHPLRISEVTLEFTPEAGDAIGISAEVAAVDRTGVEMEALTAAAVAALTIYDMVKAVDRGMVITDVRLLSKEGGRSGKWERGA